MTTSETTTLVAAVIAAAASMLGVLVTGLSIYFDRRTTKEDRHRELLSPYVVDLGDVLHQIVACSQVVVNRAKAGEPTEKWERLAGEACAKLKVLRLRVKYPLWGLDEGLSELTRLASYVSHQRDHADLRQPLLDAANALRTRLDDAIRGSFVQGRAPSASDVGSVVTAARELRSLWETSTEREPDI